MSRLLLEGAAQCCGTVNTWTLSSEYVLANPLS